MVEIEFSPKFKKLFSKIKDTATRRKILKQISKISDNPKAGKPMMHNRKGTRELYMKPYRLSYLIQNKIIYILDLYHKNKQ